MQKNDYIIHNNHPSSLPCPAQVSTLLPASHPEEESLHKTVLLEDLQDPHQVL